jgi:hypothetical protein
MRLPMRSIFEEPTVAAVAARIAELRRDQAAEPAEPVVVSAVVTSPSAIPRLQRPTVANPNR